jgi:antitoxin YobK
MFDSLRALIERADFFQAGSAGEVEPSWIDAAEEELGYPLPPSYCWWLENYGTGQLDGHPICTLAPPEFRDDADSDLIYTFRTNSTNGIGGANKLFFWEPNGDERFFFDTSKPDASGEFPVYVEDLVQGEDRQYAKTFAEFLEQEILHRLR